MSSSGDKLERAGRMLAWLVSRGGYVHPGAELRDDPTSGLSLFATSPISAQERLISCPFSVAITPSLAATGVAAATGVPVEKLIWREGEKWNHRMLAAAYIGLHWVWDDRETDTTSRPEALAHGPYIAALPPVSELTTPLYFNEAERALLQGTNLFGAVVERETEWAKESAAVREVLGEEGLTWQRYLAVSTYLSSRAFPSRLLRLPDGETATSSDDDGSDPVLLPGVDMLNHARGQPILWLSSRIQVEKSELVAAISLVAESAHAAGAELFNNYGAKPNEELLLGYGFVIPSNPDDVLGLRLGTAGLSTDVLERLEAKGLDASERFIVRRDGDLPQRLLAVVRIMMGEHEHDHDHDEEDEHAAHAHEEESLNLELDVLGMLGEMLEDKLEKVSVELDTEGARPHIVDMVAEFRKGQAEILAAALDKLGDRIERIENLMNEGMECPCGC